MPIATGGRCRKTGNSQLQPSNYSGPKSAIRGKRMMPKCLPTAKCLRFRPSITHSMLRVRLNPSTMLSRTACVSLSPLQPLPLSSLAKMLGSVLFVRDPEGGAQLPALLLRARRGEDRTDPVTYAHWEEASITAASINEPFPSRMAKLTFISKTMQSLVLAGQSNPTCDRSAAL